jgi:hypothetical protein
MCPITGLPARYKCPRTHVPYANLEAYKTIKRVEAGEFMWSSLLGAFVHRRDVKVPQGLPENWATEFGIIKTEHEGPAEAPGPKAPKVKKPRKNSPGPHGPPPGPPPSGFRPINVLNLRPAPPNLPPGWNCLY